MKKVLSLVIALAMVSVSLVSCNQEVAKEVEEAVIEEEVAPTEETTVVEMPAEEAVAEEVAPAEEVAE